MGESSGQSADFGSKIAGKLLSASASHCQVARILWPEKTAACWAAAARVQERMVKYWLSGRFPVSDAGRLATVRELASRS